MSAPTSPDSGHRPLLAPSRRARRGLRILRVIRPTRGQALAAILIVLLGGALASAALDPGAGKQMAPAAAAQPAPPNGPPNNQPPLPVPTIDADPCGSGTPPLPTCTQPTPDPTPSETGLPLPTDVPTLPPCNPQLPLQPCAPTGTPSTPCSGEGCIPHPGATTTAPNEPGDSQPGEEAETEDQAADDDCGITDVGACLTEAINDFFRGIVTAALNPLLDLLAKTLLTTPMPDSLPRIGELWNNSWDILLLCYGTLVLIAGVIAMGYQTVQTRHSIKDLAPRLVVGFLAGALSLWAATQGIRIANALAQAVTGGGVDASKPMVGPGDSFKDLILGSLTGGIWIVFLGLFLAGMLVVLLVTYVVRVALTLVLIAGAPFALMFHALPQTEGVAYWWWKAFGGCLVIQVGQSLALITGLRVFFAPGGFTMFGPNASGLVNLLLAMALLYILFKIPFWVLSSLRGGSGRRGLIGSLVRGFLVYKAFGLLGGRGRGGRGRGGGRGGGGGATPSPLSGGRGGGRRSTRGSSGGGGGASAPYAHPRTTGSGQYVLPLPGTRRARPAGTRTAKTTSQPATTRSPGKSGRRAGPRGRQMALPLDNDWPENKPVLGRDGQYRLPLTVQRETRPPATPAQTGTSRARRAGPGRQFELPFDPYKGNRANRRGQYPLPLDGVQKTQAPKPAQPPPPPVRSAARAGRQLRLPLDLPKPSRPLTPPTTPTFSPPPSPSPTPPPAPPRPARAVRPSRNLRRKDS